MDMFYVIATYIHLLAMIWLFMKIWTTNDCTGVSGKTQMLLTLVWVTRYLDVFQIYISMENSLLKGIYFLLTFITVLMVYTNKTYQRKYDTFSTEVLLVLCMALAMWLNHDPAVVEVCWTFSIYLEAVAMLPQFYLIYKAKCVHHDVMIYIMAIFAYRCLYLAHYGVRYQQTEVYDSITLSSGALYVLIFLGFFTFVLPASESKPPSVGTDPVAAKPSTISGGEMGHMTANISAVILTPSALMQSSKNDKITQPMSAKEKEATSVMVV
ncbi:ER lumen protein-retaining receptor 3-like [Trichogramma pretiosum]|uniref:ER lumen protein-retaining receptor 3-like n=1 Tax=Trichogramma pretiosum TaxID=7493 RepID=UPI0006C99E0C|nr:ER lumen protein-retaining receptor 3-like [Trichogramma pretiosum]